MTEPLTDVQIRVALAKTATKEFVLGTFVLALLVQLFAFFWIADFANNHVEADIVEMKSELRSLREMETAAAEALSEIRQISAGSRAILNDVAIGAPMMAVQPPNPLEWKLPLPEQGG